MKAMILLLALGSTAVGAMPAKPPQTAARTGADARFKALYTSEYAWRQRQMAQGEDNPGAAARLPDVGPAAQAERLARCLSEGFIYQGEGSPNHDGKPRGKPSAHLSPTAFVAFLQNHDQIGNRAMGERLTLLAHPQKLRAATALLLLGPQIPLLFMGDEQGSESPFLFFTDFHDELADAVRQGRRKEFAKFAAFADPEARKAIPDPNALETFDQSRAHPGPDAATWQALYATLLKIRHAAIIPRLRGTTAIGAEAIGERAVVARWRMGDDAVLTIALNLGDEAVAFPVIEAAPIFADGDPGQPDSIAVWLAR